MSQRNQWLKALGLITVFLTVFGIWFVSKGYAEGNPVGIVLIILYPTLSGVGFFMVLSSKKK